MYSPDGKRLASGGREGTIKIWDIPDRRAGSRDDGLDGLTELAFSPDGTLLASAGEGNIVTLWDVATGGGDSAHRLPLARPMRCLLARRNALVTGGGTVDNSSRGGWRAQALGHQYAIRCPRPWRAIREASLAVAFSPDGTKIGDRRT